MYFRASLTATAILAAGTVVGLPPLAQADVADDSFLQALDGYGLQYGTLDRAIRLAKVYVCGQLDANPGATMNDVVFGLAGNTKWSSADSAFFTGSAISAYCPQYQSIVNPTPPVDGPTNIPIS